MVEIERLVQAMHDSVCRCGGKCKGYYLDLTDLSNTVQQMWGSTTPMETYLESVRDGRE